MITKTLTVGYSTSGRFQFANGEIIPMLRITNRALHLAGFNVGTKVSEVHLKHEFLEYIITF